ncbi:MAG TPA: ABC transporter substrate-binding protein [Candidatus Dormibacteraeota bacterium]|nr:ABC transporter substrate-binding protein [Candidatus Dormibacteraeota bacterium]
MRKRISARLIVVLLCTLILGFCKREQPQLKLTPVVVNEAFEHLLYIGLYVAKDKGFFEQQGLDVKIETGGGDAQAFSALTSGSAQFAQGDPAFVAIASEKGWDGRVVAMAVDRVAIWGVTFDKSIKPFTDPVGFRGKTVATYPNPNTSYVVQKQLDEKAGLKLGRNTKILEVPFGTELSTLKNKQADIAQTIEPNVSQVELQGGVVAFSYPDAYGPLAFTGVMTSKKLIDENPQLIQKFVNAYEQSLQFIQSDFDGTFAIAEKRLPNLPPEVVRAALKRLINSGCIPKHAAVDGTSWQKLLQIRVDVGDLKGMPQKTFFDNSFADHARR